MKKKKRTEKIQINSPKKDPTSLVLICQVYLKYFVMEISSSRKALLRMIKEPLLKSKVSGSMESLTVSVLLIVIRREAWKIHGGPQWLELKPNGVRLSIEYVKNGKASGF